MGLPLAEGCLKETLGFFQPQLTCAVEYPVVLPQGCFIIDLTTTGTLVCSVSDNGAAYVTVSKATNIPAAATTLFPEASVTMLLNNTAESLEVEYLYVEQQ